MTRFILIALCLSLLAAPGRAGPDEDFETAVRLAEQGQYEEAATRLRLLAQQGHAGAQYNLGFLYDMGWGVDQDFFAAFNWYSQAADRGLAQAQYNIGVMYYLGRGVDQNFEQAFDYYTLAAEAGLPEAQTNLAYFYETGQGVEADPAAAARWYTRAAEQGSDKAQFNLGYLYAKGLGVEQNLIEAYKWFTLATMLGHEQAAKNRTLIAQAMTDEELILGDRALRDFLAEHPALAQSLQSR